MISLIVFIALLGLIYWICLTLGVPQPFLKIIMVILVVVAILAILQAFGLGTNLPMLK
jgi:hypothetical protein